MVSITDDSIDTHHMTATIFLARIQPFCSKPSMCRSLRFRVTSANLFTMMKYFCDWSVSSDTRKYPHFNCGPDLVRWVALIDNPYLALLWQGRLQECITIGLELYILRFMASGLRDGLLSLEDRANNPKHEGTPILFSFSIATSSIASRMTLEVHLTNYWAWFCRTALAEVQTTPWRSELHKRSCNRIGAQKGK